MPTCRTPEWMLLALQGAVDESDQGRKGLAARLDVSVVQLGYWLTGREQFPLLRLRQAAEALGPEHGRRLLEVVAGDAFLVAPEPGARSAEDLARAGARSMQAEGRFIDTLCEALKDGEISTAEADRLVRRATDVESLLASIRAAIRRRTDTGTRGHGDTGTRESRR